MKNSEQSMSKYHDDPEVRKMIDRWLKKNAQIECSLGLDSTKKEFAAAKIRQDRLFKKIKGLDEEFYSIITAKESEIDDGD